MSLIIRYGTHQEQSHVKIVTKFVGLVRLVNLILLQSNLKYEIEHQ